MNAVNKTPTNVDAERASRRYTARDGIRALLVVVAILVVCAGDSVHSQGEQLQPGPLRTIVLAIGHPTGWVANHLPFAGITDRLTGWLSPDENLGSDSAGGSAAATSHTSAGAVPAAAFSARDLDSAIPPLPLHRVLVTGDSMSQPLDTDLARTLADKGVLTIRDAHIGTGLSISGLVDWAKLAVHQSRTDHPDVVVMFLGANEGFPMRHDGHDVRCCSGDWGAEYATRARGMMSTYLDGGARRIVWLALPAPRDPRRQRISHLVNAAVRLAAAPFGVQVQVLPTDAVFTPGGHYRDEMTVGGQQRIVRQPDGIHLNDDGAKLAAQLTVAALRTSFRVG